MERTAEGDTKVEVFDFNGRRSSEGSERDNVKWNYGRRILNSKNTNIILISIQFN